MMVAGGIVAGVLLIFVEIAYKRHRGLKEKELELARNAADRWRGNIEVCATTWHLLFPWVSAIVYSLRFPVDVWCVVQSINLCPHKAEVRPQLPLFNVVSALQFLSIFFFFICRSEWVYFLMSSVCFVTEYSAPFM